MRALKVLGLTLCLSGCIYAGEISLWPGRDDFIAGLSSYGIEYLDKDGPKLIKTETVTESDFTPNKMLTAYKGIPLRIRSLIRATTTLRNPSSLRRMPYWFRD